MNCYFEKIPSLEAQAFVIKEYNLPVFEAPRHFHPQLELTFILESEGKRFVGDNISDFKAGDLVLLGPKLPHYWHSTKKHDGHAHRSRSIVTQFNREFLGLGFLEKAESIELRNLFDRSAQGLWFSGNTQTEVGHRLKMLCEKAPEGLQRIIDFLTILNILAKSKEYVILSSSLPASKEVDIEETDRIDKIYKYVLNNYADNINLDEAASLIFMNKTTFCHYFKKRTSRTFSDFVNEIRIGHACKLLLDTNKNISEICYESGFNNLSNFNRRFKEIKSLSPIQFRKHFIDSLHQIKPRDEFQLSTRKTIS